jgi:trimeric autotransporter adhesin
MWRCIIVFGALVIGFSEVAVAAPITYLVKVDTSSISGTAGSLDFNFNPGPLVAQTASLQITGFSSDGTLAGSPPLTGDARGTLPGSLTFDNGTAFNDYFSGFTFGKSLSFYVNLSGPALSSPDGVSTSGSAFAFSIFSDTAGTKPALTTDTTNGFGFIVNVNLDGTTSATNNLKGSTSVVLQPTVTVVPSAQTTTAGQPLSVTITVSGGNGNPVPTGSVTLTGGGYTSAATALTSGGATITIPAGSLATGTDTLTASYAGDSSYDSGTGTASVTIARSQSMVTVTPSAQSITTAQSLSVTVLVSGGNGNLVPTGTVTLAGGGYTSAATTLASGSGTIAVPAGSLATGTDALTATYSGDGNYTTGTGAASVTVTMPVPAGLAVTGTSVTVTPGATTGNTSTITVTPSGGFTGSVVLTAAVTSSPAAAQDPPTLSFASTSPVSITGTTAGTATLTISTTAAMNAALTGPPSRQLPWYAASSATLACVVFFGIPARRRRWRTMLGLVLFLVSVASGLSACGGGGMKGTSNPGTTAGSYTVTVTATSGATTATGTVALTVQ